MVTNRVVIENMYTDSAPRKYLALNIEEKRFFQGNSHKREPSILKWIHEINTIVQFNLFITGLKTNLNLLFLNLSQTSNSTSNGDSRSSAQTVSTSSYSFLARPAVPDSYTGSLHRVLSAECTTVGGMLRYLNLSHELTERSTVTGTVLSCDSYLLCTLSHDWSCECGQVWYINVREWNRLKNMCQCTTM